MTTLKYFMWGYQEHFADSLKFRVKSIVAALGLGKIEAEVLLVGLRRPGAEDRNPVCVSPEDGGWSIANFVSLEQRTEEFVESHPRRNMFFSNDETATRQLPENIRKDSVKQSALELGTPVMEAKGLAPFASSAVAAGNFHVVALVGVPASVLLQENVLPVPVQHHDFKGNSSLVEAAIGVVLEDAAEELARPDPGRLWHGRGRTEEEMLRKCAREFMWTLGIALGDSAFYENRFSSINEISALFYEKKEGEGVFIVTDPAAAHVTYALRFASPIPLRNARWSRKAMELADRENALVADCTAIHGLGRLNDHYVPGKNLAFRIEFAGHHRWRLCADDRALMECEFGLPRVPRRSLSKEGFVETFSRVFPGTSRANHDAAWAICEEIERLPHGCMVTFCQDAAQEADRLQHQGMVTLPALMTPSVLGAASSIDGTVILDPASNCHAIGVILDGMASDKCHPSRGSRFNSAVRHVRAGGGGRLAIVRSDDGMIDVIPLLAARIPRRDIEAHVAAIESANRQTVHAPRNWLDEHRFYLDQAQCCRVNEALARIEAEPATHLTAIWVIVRPFAPDPDFNDSYLLDLLPNPA